MIRIGDGRGNFPQIHTKWTRMVGAKGACEDPPWARGDGQLAMPGRFRKMPASLKQEFPWPRLSKRR